MTPYEIVLRLIAWAAGILFASIALSIFLGWLSDLLSGDPE